MRFGRLSRASLGALALVVLGTGLVMLIVVGSTQPTAIVVLAGQVLGDLAVVVLAGAVALRTRGRTRLMWALVCAAFVAWLLADAAYLLDLIVGGAPGGVGGVDAGWIVFALLMAAAVVVMYAGVRPERGWQGALDALALAGALGAIGWALLAGPLDFVERVGAVDTTFELAYPVLAIGPAAVVAWLVLRTGGGPSWMRAFLLAMLLLVAGEMTHLAMTAAGAEGPVIGAWLLYSASAWTWAFAALERLRGGESVWADGARETPPAWSDAVPALAMLSAVGVIAWGAGLLGAAVLAVTAIAVGRFVITNRANSRLSAQHARQALTDPLTGALNRRSLERELRTLTARSRRSGGHLTALALDLDGFKAVNDSRGHAEGDRLLIAFAQTLRGGLREGDLLFRVGGDEFVALLPDTSAAEALVIAERLRRAVSRVAAQERAPGVTVSVGIAEGPPRWSSPEALLVDADRALYRAKSGGRDRVVLSPLPRPSGSDSTLPEGALPGS